jgi:very-short-patch-repair endonuclease
VKRKDAHKDAAFEKNGWILLRFSNSSVLDHINMVVDEIKGVMKNRERGVM